jgi:DNA-binding GntR family transcriptional regulator
MENVFKTMQEVIYDTIRERIISRVYEPGQRLIANELAEELNVSRMPVREALARLATTGLVELIPYKGAIVNKLTAEDYVEIFHIRSVLEGLAARLACENLSEDDLEVMQKANEEALEMINEQEDDEKFQRINRNFHSIIWKRTGSIRLQQLLSNLYTEAAQYRHMTVIMPGRLKEICEEHDSILDAFTKQDANLAEECVKVHYEHTLEWLVKILNK